MNSASRPAIKAPPNLSPRRFVARHSTTRLTVGIVHRIVSRSPITHDCRVRSYPLSHARDIFSPSHANGGSKVLASVTICRTFPRTVAAVLTGMNSDALLFRRGWCSSVLFPCVHFTLTNAISAWQTRDVKIKEMIPLRISDPSRQIRRRWVYLEFSNHSHLGKVYKKLF
jgi:hypothetical protein